MVLILQKPVSPSWITHLRAHKSQRTPSFKVEYRTASFICRLSFALTLIHLMVWVQKRSEWKLKWKYNIIAMVSLMGALKNLETPSRLFGSITDRTRPFLNRLSETKYLAVTNFQKAADQYLELVRQTLEFSEKRLVAVQRYSEPYHSVKRRLRQANSVRKWLMP